MNLLLSFKDWMTQNGLYIFLIAIIVVYLVFTFTKQKKDLNTRNELINSITKGTKIVTTAGVYGVVDSVENTTDGKVLTILTGSPNNQTSMTIHINAVMGIDNKSLIAEDGSVISGISTTTSTTDDTKTTEDVSENIVTTKKTTAKKKTTNK